MTFNDIPGIRLYNQQILAGKFTTAEELVAYMGAMQAQDYPMARWAVGLRLKEADEQSITSVIDRGNILRTHLLRPTWHFVSSSDIYWILRLTAPGIKASMKSRNKQLGLSQAVFKKSNSVIESALRDRKSMTRGELIEILRKEKINTEENRASHLLMEAELDGIICSGISDGNKATYALLEDRVKNSEDLSRDESLAKLAGIYFRSRGPATINDFSWWSGLKLTDARRALEMIKPQLSSFNSETQAYWLTASPSGSLKIPAGKLTLLPTYDEFLISYNDRSAVISSGKYKGIISSNGIFRAVILYNGKVTGTWKRNIKNGNVLLEMNYLNKPSRKTKELVQHEALKFAAFLKKEISNIIHN